MIIMQQYIVNLNSIIKMDKRQSFLFLFVMMTLPIIIITQYSLTINTNTVNLKLMQKIILINNNYTCGKLQSVNSYLYHLANQILQVRQVKNISYLASYLNQQNSGYNIIDYDVDNTGNSMVFLNPGSLLEEVLVYSLNSGVPTQTSSMQGNNYTLPSKVFINANIIYRYYKSTSNASDSILVQPLYSPLGNSYTFLHKNASIAFSPNYQFAVAWTGNTQIYIYNTINFNLLYIFNQSMVGTLYTTNTIKFSQDSSLIVIEADQFASVKVLNLTSFSVIYSFTISTAVTGAVFLTNNVVLILVKNLNNTLWFLSENVRIYITNLSIAATTFQIDSTNQYLFTCYSNTIYSYYLGNSTNTTTITNNTVFNNNTSNKTINNSSSSTANNLVNITSNSTINTTNNTSITPTQQYSISINFSETQKNVYDGLNTTLSTSQNNIFQKIVMFAISTPLTFYFLSFLNFLTLSCLYILLNFILPTPIFTILNDIYFSISSNLLSLIGISPNIQLFPQEMVTNQKDLYFGITSDVLLSNYAIITFFVINIGVALLSNYVSKKLKQKTFWKELLCQNMFKIISGQIIAAMITFCLPWRFVIFGGALLFSTKINLAFQYILFFIAFIFPFYYLLKLLREQKRIILSSREIQTTQKRQKARNIFFKDLITTQIFEEWSICFSNLIYPLLVILQSPLVFLTIIGIYLCIGLAVAFKKKTQKYNSIVLALYPILYHICFLIFYCSQDQNNLANTCLLCILVIIIGSFHNLFSIIIKGILKVRLGVKKNQNKVQQEPLQMNKNKQNLKDIENLIQDRICEQELKKNPTVIFKQEQMKQSMISMTSFTKFKVKKWPKYKSAKNIIAPTTKTIDSGILVFSNFDL